MAKKKKQKSPSDAASREAPAATKDVAASPIERAFAVGNFAAVRRLAREHPGPDAERLLPLVKVESVPLAVGLGALLVMVLVAMMVLRAG